MMHAYPLQRRICQTASHGEHPSQGLGRLAAFPFRDPQPQIHNCLGFTKS